MKQQEDDKMADSSKIYPRTGDAQTVYLKNVITRPNIEAGDYSMYNDFIHDPAEFEQNNVFYQYPINQDRLIIGKFCSIARLLRLQWWDWPKEKIKENIRAIQTGRLDQLK